MHSQDDGETWSTPEALFNEPGAFTKNNVRLRDAIGDSFRGCILIMILECGIPVCKSSLLSCQDVKRLLWYGFQKYKKDTR